MLKSFSFSALLIILVADTTLVIDELDNLCVSFGLILPNKAGMKIKTINVTSRKLCYLKMLTSKSRYKMYLNFYVKFF